MDEETIKRLAALSGADAYKRSSTEEDIVDKYHTDTLYTHQFRDGTGKYFTVVSSDENDVPNAIDVEPPQPRAKNKVKTTLTFIKSAEGGYIKDISLKRFKYYQKDGWVEKDERIVFSYKLFRELIGFLQSLTKLNLNDLNERRIPLGNSPGLDSETIRQFNTFTSTPEGQELMRETIRTGNITTVDIVNIGYRKAQLEVFEKLLSLDGYIEIYRAEKKINMHGVESVWQHFFESNPWIFGYGLNYIFNEPLEGKKLEQVVQGADVAQSGKRADGILKTSGVVNSLCLVEIKSHKTDLIKKVPYRADCWQPSDELSGGIVQSQKTTQKTIENLAISPEFRGHDREGSPTGEVVYSYQPKSYLIIGNLSEFVSEAGVNKSKFASFELLRKNMRNPEIITFDELFERTKFIVLNTKSG